MARIPHLANLTYADLVQLKAEVAGQIVARQAEEKDTLKTKLSEMAMESGFSLDEIMGKVTRKGSKVAVKYRDPKDSSNTWTGRGRMPLWIAAATKARGVKKEDFLV